MGLKEKLIEARESINKAIENASSKTLTSKVAMRMDMNNAMIKLREARYSLDINRG